MGHKILLADDSITIQKVIELTFSDEDFELHTVGNGQKAIDEIRSIMPHIVLCDIIMPEKNGYEVCEFIKSSPDLKHVPVLLLTGAFEPFDQERARSAGCDGFLAKPFEPQTLISKVKELLERAPAAPAAAPRPQAAAPRPAPAPPAAPVRPPAPPPPPAPAFDDADERTVMMSPPAAVPPPPARAPQPPPPAPPPPAPDFESGGLDDAFAVEAGERELVMDERDHTVLLGGRESKSEPEPPSGGDDIWGEVIEPVEPAPLEAEDSSTVFMAQPPPISAPPNASPYEVQYESDDLDATWRMPSSDESEPATGAPDYGGFEEFAEPLAPEEPISLPSPPAHEAVEPLEEEPSFEMPPPLTPSPPRMADYEPADPFSAAAEPPGFKTDQTIDSAVDDGGYEAASQASEFESYGEPEIVEPEPESMFEPEPSSEPFDELDSSSENSMPAPMDEFGEAPFGAPAPAPSSNHSSGNSSTPLDDDLIEKIAQRVLDRLSEKVVQEIAWEVVPDLAEGLIRREIEALKAKIPK